MDRLKRLTEVARLMKANTKVHNILERNIQDEGTMDETTLAKIREARKSFVFPDQLSESGDSQSSGFQESVVSIQEHQEQEVNKMNRAELLTSIQ